MKHVPTIDAPTVAPLLHRRFANVRKRGCDILVQTVVVLWWMAHLEVARADIATTVDVRSQWGSRGGAGALHEGGNHGRQVGPGSGFGPRPRSGPWHQGGTREGCALQYRGLPQADSGSAGRQSADAPLQEGLEARVSRLEVRAR